MNIIEIYKRNRFDPEIDVLLSQDINLLHNPPDDFHFYSLLDRFLAKDTIRKCPDYYWLDRIITIYNQDVNKLLFFCSYYTSDREKILLPRFFLGYSGFNIKSFWNLVGFDMVMLKLAIKCNVNTNIIIDRDLTVCFYFLLKRIGTEKNKRITDSFLYKLFLYSKRRNFIPNISELNYVIMLGNIPYKILKYCLTIFEYDPNKLDFSNLVNVKENNFQKYVNILIRYGLDINSVIIKNWRNRENYANHDKITTNLSYLNNFVKNLKRIIGKWRRFVLDNKRRRITDQIKYLPGIGIEYFASLQHFTENCQ